MKTAFYSFVFAVFPKIAKGKARGFLLKEGGVPGVRWQREKWPPWAWFRIGVRGTHVTDTGPLEERAHVMQAGPFP